MEEKRLSQSIVPRGNLRVPAGDLIATSLVDAEIVVRIFDVSIPRRALSDSCPVLAPALGALRRFWFDGFRGRLLRLVIVGGKIDRRDFRQRLLRLLRREGFRDADGLLGLERRAFRGALVAHPIQQSEQHGPDDHEIT